MAGAGTARAGTARAGTARAGSGAGGVSRAVQPRLDDAGTPLFATTFVALDLETTGLSPDRDRITEIGAVKVRGGEVLGELRTFVHPGAPIPPAITALTGITDAMVRDAPTIGAVLPTVLRFLDGCVFVAHNARFDVSFLRAAASRASLTWPEPTVLDTARLAGRLLRDEVRDRRLATLAAHLRTPSRPDHRALSDARATIDVLHGLFERAGSLGATTVEDLVDLTRSRSDRAFRRRGLVADAPAACGVYRFLDARGEVLYIGKATDLRARLRTYFGQDPRRRIADMVRETAEVRWTTTSTLLEAEVLEVRALQATRPRFNRRSTDPQPGMTVALTAEPFPRLVVTAAPGRGHGATLGPVPSRRVARDLVEVFQSTLPVRPCTPRLRLAQDHGACVLKELGRCRAPCDGTISRDEYARDIARVVATFDDPTPVLEELRHRMATAAAAHDFERARGLRAALHTTARAFGGVRARSALLGVAELVAARPDGDHVEVVRLRHGRLVTSARVAQHLADDEAALLRAVTPAPTLPHLDTDGATPDGAPGTSEDPTEELGLVGRWLARPGVRVLAAEGTYASPVAGGAALATTLAEATALARTLRRDHQLLRGVKVREVQTSSNQPLVASGPLAGSSASRPSQATRTR
jgi:DNA polymerase-3 subunit epsilon